MHMRLPASKVFPFERTDNLCRGKKSLYAGRGSRRFERAPFWHALIFTFHRGLLSCATLTVPVAG